MIETHIISLKDVDSSSQAADNQQLFLKSINLTVGYGEMVAVIGRTDSGKSALLRCIGLLDRPLTGIISIDNKNLTFLASSELCNERRNVAYLSGKPSLLESKNIRDNIALPLQIQGYSKDEIIKSVSNSMSLAKIDNKSKSFVSELSAMQIVQVELARALVSSPKVILCDDIFSGLDQKSTEYLCNLLHSLMKDSKLTIILNTNDAAIIRNYCSSVIVMQQGTIVERCSVYTLFTTPNSEVAKEFVRFTTKHELPYSLRRKIVTEELPQHHAVVRINFNDCIAPEEILTNSLDAYELRMNIIQAYQERLGDEIVNLMIIEIFGKFDIIREAVQFLSHNDLQSEIIGYVPDIT